MVMVVGSYSIWERVPFQVTCMQLVVGSCRSQMPCRLVVVVEYHSMMVKNRCSLRIGMVMGKSKVWSTLCFLHRQMIWLGAQAHSKSLDFT